MRAPYFRFRKADLFSLILVATALLTERAHGEVELLASGSNSQGQFGIGTTAFSSGVVSISQDTTVFAAGFARTFFVKSDGTLWAAGSNDQGQLGDGTTERRISPVQVAADVSSVAAGGRTLILKKDKSLWWIPGFTGSRPVQIASGVKKAAAGPENLAYITEDGTLWTVHIESGFYPDQPSAIKTATNVIAVAVGRAHLLFVKGDGSLWGLGDNFFGQLGEAIGQADRTETPVKIAVDVKRVAAGQDQSFFIKTDATLWAMGANDFGELGDGTRQARRVPAQISTDVADVSVGVSHCLFLKEDGTTWGMGDTRNGQLGVVDGDKVSNSPVLIIAGIKAIQAGAYHSLFLRDANAGADIAIALSETSREVGADGGRYTIGVFSNKDWLPRTEAPWLNFTRRLVAEDGLLEIEVEPNTGSLPRSAEITISGFTHSVIQRARGAAFRELLAFGRDAEGQLGVSNAADVRRPAQIATRMRMVAAGSVWGAGDQVAHVLALRTDGELWGFGRNNWGQLGQAPDDTVLNWVKVASGVSQMAATASYNVFLKTDGTLWRLGEGLGSQTATGESAAGNIPVLLSANVSSFSASDRHMLFIKTDGSLWAVGSNESGQLGDGSRSDRSAPVQIATNVAQAAAGFYHSLFVKTDGTMWGMGQTWLGELGDGGTEQVRVSPYQLRGGVRAVAAGFNRSFFIDVEGGLWGMGAAPLGNGALERQLTPAKIAQGVTFVVSSWEHTFFLKADGTLWGMGANLHGELGDGTLTGRPTPVKIADEVKHAAATDGVTLFVKSDGSLWAMGDTDDFLWNRRPTPLLVDAKVSGIAAGALHSAYIKEDGTLWAMGPQFLGNGLAVGSSKPVRIADSVERVAAGEEFTLFVKKDGGLWTVGREAPNLFGTNAQSAQVPVQVDAGVVDIAAGTYHALYVKTDGSLFATGNNYSGQLGVEGLEGSTKTPARSTTGVLRAAASYHHSLVLKTDGTLWAVGDTGLTAGSTKSMIQVASNVVDLAAGREHSLFLKRDSTLWAWGDNFERQLGDSTNQDRGSPVQVAEDVAYFAGGIAHTVFAKTDGTLWTVGGNDYGQLGDGTFTARGVPKMIARGALRVSAGQGYHTLFVRDSSLPVIGEPTTLLSSGHGAFDVVAEGSETLAYQWERCVSVESGWETLTDGNLWTGAKQRRLVIADSAVFAVGERFRCRVQNAAGPLASVSIKTRAAAITTHPSSVTIEAGRTVSITASATGVPAPRLQWQQRLAGETQWQDVVEGELVDGAKSGTLTLIAAAKLNGAQFRCSAANGVGDAVASSMATLTVIGGHPYAGTYFGTISGGSGTWALVLGEDGTGTLIAHRSKRSSLAVLKVMVATDGALVGTGTEYFPGAGQASLQSDASGRAVKALSDSTLTLAGLIKDSSLSASISGSAESMAGTLDAQYGSAPQGYYTARSTDHAAASMHAIIAPSGQTFVIAMASGIVASVSGRTSADGEFSAVWQSGNELLLNLAVVEGQVEGTAKAVGSSIPVVFGNARAEEPDPDAPVPADSTTRLVALSARCRAGSGDQTLIMGFVVEGSKQVLLQGIGPGIANSVPTALTDPQLKVYRLSGGSWSTVAENNDWVNGAEILQARTRLGASAVAQGSKDAALLEDLNGGVYTAHVTTTGAAGVALVEAYDADASGGGRLMALATRTVAGAGDDTLIAGLVLEGNGPKTVLIRGLGPTLASRDGVTGVLSDPQLKLYRMAGGTSTLVGENDNWGGAAEMKNVFTTIGAGQLESDGSKDAAMLATLEPGVYTVHVTGAEGTTGVALVEIFDVE